MKRGTDELQRRGSFVDEQRGEEHGEQRLEREEHRGPRRGQPPSETVIRSQPTTCELSASARSHSGRLEGRREVEITQDQAGGDDEDAVASVASKSGPGDAAPLAGAPSQRKQEARVGDSGEESEDRAELRVASVGAVLQNTRDEEDSGHRDRDREQGVP